MKNFHLMKCFTVVIVLFWGIGFDVLNGDDWPQFLGKNRDGKSAETGLISSWSQTDLKPVWRVPVGEGMSGIAVVGNQCYTLYQDRSDQYVICLRADSGKVLWKTPIAPRYRNSMGDGPRATPSVVGDQVFVYSGEGILACLDRNNGEVAWKTNTALQNSPEPAEYGMSGSPLVVGKQVIVTTSPGERGFSLCGYSIEDGKFQWGTNNQPTGYASPALLNCGKSQLVVAFSGKSLFGVEPESGKLIWRYPFATAYNCNTASPINVGNQVLISSGENHGSVRLKFKPGSGRDLVVGEVWKSVGKESTLRSEWQTPIEHEGFLYGMDNVGSASAVTHLTCVDARTGKRVWRKPRFGKGNLIYADGKLIITTMKGELVLVKASPDGFAELGRQKVLGRTRQAPALANGRVFLRDDSEVVCIDLRASR